MKNIIIFCTVQRKFKCQLSISYHKLRQKFITNCDKNLLQITTAKLLQITTKFYYKLRQFYYKLRQLLQIATSLLQITTAITNCDNYYKLRQNTKNPQFLDIFIVRLL